jgi:hypothetical protein
MVMVVAYTVLEPGRRPGGLNSPDQTFGDEEAEGIVDRLKRDGADLGPDRFGHAVGRDVRLTRDRSKDCQSLRGHLDAALPKESRRVGWHRDRVTQ